MGIAHLYTFLKQTYPKVRHTLRWDHHRGQTWGIDISPLMFRARGDQLSPLTVIAHLIIRMRCFGIRPIVVFDGQPTEAKMALIEKRRQQRRHIAEQIQAVKAHQEEISEDSELYGTLENEILQLQQQAPNVTAEDRNAIKQFLYAAGILYVVAEGEADDVLGYLARCGEIQGVVSTDMDMLIRGFHAVIVPETTDASVLTVIFPTKVAAEMGVTMKEFQEACILMGTDYTTEIHPQTPGAAVQIVKRDRPHTALRTAEQFRALAYIQGLTASCLWTHFLNEKQRERYANGDPSPEPDNLTELVEENGWPREWLRVLL